MLSPKLSRFISLGQLFILGAGATLALSSRANATELITLQYKDRSALVTIDDLSRFARTGAIPQSIQDLFATTDKIPSDISTILNKELKISRQFVDSFIDSAIGDFVLGGLDEVINNASSSRDLTNVRSTLVAAYEDDNRVSLIELIERYPQNEVQINVTSLEKTYNTVNGIVEDVLPALEVAKTYVQDLVCDCDEPVAQLSEDGTKVLVANNNINCQKNSSIAENNSQSEEETIAQIMARNSTTLVRDK